MANPGSVISKYAADLGLPAAVGALFAVTLLYLSISDPIIGRTLGRTIVRTSEKIPARTTSIHRIMYGTAKAIIFDIGFQI